MPVLSKAMIIVVPIFSLILISILFTRMFYSTVSGIDVLMVFPYVYELMTTPSVCLYGKWKYALIYPNN